LAILLTIAALLAPCATPAADAGGPADRLQKRWLFGWHDMNDPKEVDRVIARLPAARAAGYNALVMPGNVAPARLAALKAAAAENGLEFIIAVMGGFKDRNYVEGVLSRDALFVVEDGRPVFHPDNPTVVRNGDFEDVAGNHFKGWAWQDDEGVTTFADHEITHSGKTSLRMENIAKNEGAHCRISQPLKLAPHRQYHISAWVRTENLAPCDPEIKVLTTNAGASISFQTFHANPTQDWKRYDLVFNSLDNTQGLLYLGTWNGKAGKMWWDDLKIEEIGLVNVLRRPGCPLTVRDEGGTVFEEGRDFLPVKDPQLHPWVAFHEAPQIRLAPGTRIKNGMRLGVGYYHPIIVYQDRLTGCITEPKILDEWREEVRDAEARFHPAGFLMSHDEMRVMNQCALCQSKHLTPGELLAVNIRQSAAIIREIRPDAEIWVWNDMFDPMHNAVDHYYAVNGTLAGSWKGLTKDVGIVNWHGGLKGKNCQFFADRGLRQVLSGYYDSDEDGSGIAAWQAATKDVPGIVGAMYTTWEDKYGAMTPWARKAWGTVGK